jgi:hypothetical protein
MSVMSPAAIPMNVEECDDKLKRGSGQGDRQDPQRGAVQYQPSRAGPPALLPTPANLRRSQRTSSRKGATPVEVENRVDEESTVKITMTRASAISKMTVDLDQEEEVVAATPKVQQEEPKGQRLSHALIGQFVLLDCLQLLMPIS